MMAAACGGTRLPRQLPAAVQLLLWQLCACCAAVAASVEIIDWPQEQQRWAAGDDPAGQLQHQIDYAIARRSPQLQVPAGRYLFGQ